jgi:putative tryptophan/tyrosine transport system substrate-binding protein
MASPVAARGQQPGRVYRLAIAHPATPAKYLHTASASPRFFGPFFTELAQRGYAEGKNLSVEAYSGEGQSELYPPLVDRVVATKPDAIFTFGTLAPVFKAATTTIPLIVFLGDDVLSTVAVNFAHPGGNTTGLTITPGAGIWGKRMALLLQAVPKAKRVGFLWTRAQWTLPRVTEAADSARKAAQGGGVSVVPSLIEETTEAEYRRAFAAATSELDALLVSDNAEHYAFANLLAGLSTAARVPTLFPDRFYVDAGGMMSYGIDFPDLFRHAGDDVAQIFGGAKPGDIPFYQPTRYELVINLKTAKNLGVTIPAMLQTGADDLIE